MEGILGTINRLPWWEVPIFCFGIAWIVIAPLLLYRNEWVRVQRNKRVEIDMEDYLRLPSYDMMLAQFWIWDINKFKRKNK